MKNLTWNAIESERFFPFAVSNRKFERTGVGSFKSAAIPVDVFRTGRNNSANRIWKTICSAAPGGETCPVSSTAAETARMGRAYGVVLTMIVGVWKTSDEERVTNGLNTADCGGMWTTCDSYGRNCALRERACTRLTAVASARGYRGTGTRDGVGATRFFTVTGPRGARKLQGNRTPADVRMARENRPDLFFALSADGTSGRTGPPGNGDGRHTRKHWCPERTVVARNPPSESAAPTLRELACERSYITANVKAYAGHRSPNTPVGSPGEPSRVGQLAKNTYTY